MQELITRLTEKAGISADQATKAIETIKEFVKEKFPMLGGAVDNMFSPSSDNSATAASSTMESPKVEGHGMLDKISDVIPGQTGEKVEEFAKNAAHKAGEVYENLKDKIGGMLGGDKK